MSLYVHGVVLGTEVKGKQDKPFTIIHVLDGFDKTEVICNGAEVKYLPNDVVDIPVKIFKEKFYETK